MRRTALNAMNRALEGLELENCVGCGRLVHRMFLPQAMGDAEGQIGRLCEMCALKFKRAVRHGPVELRVTRLLPR